MLKIISFFILTSNIVNDIFTKASEPVTPIAAHVLNGTHRVSALALLNDQLFISRLGVAQVSVYNASSLVLIRQLSFAGLGATIYGLAACATYNYLYIADYDNHCIHRIYFSVAGEDTLIKWKVANNPLGLSVNSARNVLVAYSAATKVQEYTPTGSLVRELSDSNGLFQAVELSSGVWAVTRIGPIHGLFIESLATKVRHSYGNQVGSGAGQMNGAQGLTVDSSGYILVADMVNDRLLVMNPSLTDARQLPLPVSTALYRPMPIILDESRGRLYVGECGGKNRLFVFDNVINIGNVFHN